MHKEIRNLCFLFFLFFFFLLLLVIYVGICCFELLPKPFSFLPSSFGVGLWFVSACCALACSSPRSGCSVSAHRDFNNKINLQDAETRQTPTLLLLFSSIFLLVARLFLCPHVWLKGSLPLFIFCSFHWSFSGLAKKFWRHIKYECSAEGWRIDWFLFGILCFLCLMGDKFGRDAASVWFHPSDWLHVKTNILSALDSLILQTKD